MRYHKPPFLSTLNNCEQNAVTSYLIQYESESRNMTQFIKKTVKIWMYHTSFVNSIYAKGLIGRPNP